MPVFRPSTAQRLERLFKILTGTKSLRRLTANRYASCLSQSICDTPRHMKPKTLTIELRLRLE